MTSKCSLQHVLHMSHYCRYCCWTCLPPHTQAMQEAGKHLAKSRATDREAQLAVLQESVDRISRFVQAHSLMAQDPAAAVALCQQLLQEAPEQPVSWGRRLL